MPMPLEPPVTTATLPSSRNRSRALLMGMPSFRCVTSTTLSGAKTLSLRVVDALPGSCLPGLGLDAVIDGTQTGPRVRFNIREPTQQGARQRVDRRIGDRGFIPVAYGWTLPLRLPGLAPANFLDVGQSGAAHLETFCEVRVRGIRPGVTQLGDAALEHVVMA